MQQQVNSRNKILLVRCEVGVPSREEFDDGCPLRSYGMVLDGQHQLFVGRPGGPLPQKGVEMLAPSGQANKTTKKQQREEQALLL